MPLPMPEKHEDRTKFLDRCMGNPTMNSDFPDNKQRYAVCNSQWQRHKHRKAESSPENG